MKIEHSEPLVDRTLPEYAIVLKARRVRLKKTQEEVAFAIGLSAMGLSHFESGTRMPKLDLLDRWAKTLGAEITITIKDAP